MITINDIFKSAETMIHAFIRKEMRAQGHKLTGKLSDSLKAKITTSGNFSFMEGFAAYYIKFVNDGFPARSASFKQAPFLIRYFVLRGFERRDAVWLAFATIKKWMKEGMPTVASNRFSSVTRRKLMIENAFQDNDLKLNKHIEKGFDRFVEERYRQEKSEII